MTDPNGGVTEYIYDASHKMLTIKDPRQIVFLTNEYDTNGRVKKQTQADGSTFQFAYTLDGTNVTQVDLTDPRGNVRRTTFDSNGYPTTNTYALGTSEAQTITHEWQAGSNLLLSVTDALVISGQNRKTSYTYHAKGNVATVTRMAQDAANSVTTKYDKAGNRTNIGGSWARTAIPHNVTSTSYDANNRQLTFGDKTLAYDDNGNLTSITDANGTTLYSWNARNKLVAISGPNMNASFVYDGLGRRENKTINNSLTEFLYDGVNPVQETSGAAVLANILPGLGTDEFFSRTDLAAGVTSSILPDALGSSVALTDAGGAVQTEYAHEPFGKTTVVGTSNTNSFQYAGRENDGTGLYYYRNRYYHPGLQRFISEDPLRLRKVLGLPEKGPLGGKGGLDWQPTRSAVIDHLGNLAGLPANDMIRTAAVDSNMYRYVLNHPLSYTDPSGENPIGWAIRWVVGKIVGWLAGKPMESQWPREELDDDKDGIPNWQDPDSELCRMNCEPVPPPKPPSKSQNDQEY